ncbi:hypothetical protein CC2G_004692 [Coprinopsis cinerea AmutBmut pab1-1]|nr:hypothetical protein CC2G_004692 [Coprinopsis cinerea AmutBmut pab1-1]
MDLHRHSHGLKPPYLLVAVTLSSDLDVELGGRVFQEGARQGTTGVAPPPTLSIRGSHALGSPSFSRDSFTLFPQPHTRLPHSEPRSI